MRVRECYADVMRGPDGAILCDRDGQPICLPGERWIDVPDVLTEAQALEIQAQQARAAERAALQAQMDAADVRIVRALIEGDSARLAQHQAEQVARRERLRALA